MDLRAINKILEAAISKPQAGLQTELPLKQ